MESARTARSAVAMATSACQRPSIPKLNAVRLRVWQLACAQRRAVHAGFVARSQQGGFSQPHSLPREARALQPRRNWRAGLFSLMNIIWRISAIQYTHHTIGDLGEESTKATPETSYCCFLQLECRRRYTSWCLGACCWPWACQILTRHEKAAEENTGHYLCFAYRHAPRRSQIRLIALWLPCWQRIDSDVCL